MQQQQVMEANSRVVKALNAMKAIDLSNEDTNRHVLKNLLKVFQNWKPIEVDNYRVLADAILDYQENQVEEERKKRKDADLSNDFEPLHKKLNSNRSENRDSLPGSSGTLFRGTPKVDDGEIEDSTPFFIRRRVVTREPDSAGLSPSGKQNQQKLVQPREREGGLNVPKPVLHQTYSNERGKKKVSLSQAYSRQDIAGESHNCPWSNRQESGSLSRQARYRDKGKEPISYQNGVKENGAVSGRVSIGVSFKEPKVEHGKMIVHNDFHYNALPQNLNDQFEMPITVLPPLNQYPGDKEDGEDGSDSISPTELNAGLSLELANIPENSFSNFEITSSPLGEVKISLSCSSSTGHPYFHKPSLDAVLKLAGDRGLKSHKIVDSNFSMVELMEELCQHFLGLTANHTNDINSNRSGHYLKKSNSAGVFGSEGSHQAYSSSNGTRNDLNDHHLMQSNKKLPECNGVRIKKEDQNGFESSNSHSLVLVQHPQYNVDHERQPHNLDDIAKGEERVKIPVVNQINSELYPPLFQYIPQNTVYQNAYVNFSLARIGDQDSCSECFGDCVTSPIPCACARETGGLFAYTANGIVKRELLDECILMRREPPNDHFYFCKDCPLERSKHGLRKCKGHFLRKFIKECWNKCGCDRQCGNRVVQRGITRNLQVFFTQEYGKGWGVRTMEDLPTGAFVCEYVGEILTNTELYNRNEERSGNEKHTYPVLLDADWGSEGRLEDEEALCLDATRFGNVARFINHRCYDANLVEIPVEIETPDHHYYHLAFFTSRPIAASEELTWDYGIDFHDLNHPIKAFRCHCGSKYCRDMALANR